MSDSLDAVRVSGLTSPINYLCDGIVATTFCDGIRTVQTRDSKETAKLAGTYKCNELISCIAAYPPMCLFAIAEKGPTPVIRLMRALDGTIVQTLTGECHLYDVYDV